MTLWHLQPIPTRTGAPDPWNRWYDTTSGFVIRAESEQEARAMTEGDAGCELENNNGKNPWLDPSLTSCVELTLDGKPTVVSYSFNAG
jgi:hypothetical protein